MLAESEDGPWSDSPLTAEGDLLDEIRFAVRSFGVSPLTAYKMVTTIPASILRLDDAEGSIKEIGLADLIAIRDTGQNPAEMMETMSMTDVEFVMLEAVYSLPRKRSSNDFLLNTARPGAFVDRRNHTLAARAG